MVSRRTMRKRQRRRFRANYLFGMKVCRQVLKSADLNNCRYFPPSVVAVVDRSIVFDIKDQTPACVEEVPEGWIAALFKCDVVVSRVENGGALSNVELVNVQAVEPLQERIDLFWRAVGRLEPLQVPLRINTWQLTKYLQHLLHVLMQGAFGTQHPMYHRVLRHLEPLRTMILRLGYYNADAYHAVAPKRTHILRDAFVRAWIATDHHVRTGSFRAGYKHHLGVSLLSRDFVAWMSGVVRAAQMRT